MIVLELKSISWRNFLSYGDYVSSLEISDLGQCLITGEVIEGDLNKESLIHKSNGAGKSTIPNVIQWVLFGRTMHSRSPGDSVVNYFTGKDCYGQIVFKNGDSITRTRNTDGKNELIFIKDGDESRLAYDTLATAALQQKKLNKVFDLDWEVFCGSVFFNQYGKPWMEMADATRKKAIERVLHVDRLTYYANAAKIRCGDLDLTVSRLKSQSDNLRSNINRLNAEIERLNAASASYDSHKLIRINEIKNMIKDEEAKKKEVILPDVEKLKIKWELITKAEQKITELRLQHNTKNTELSKNTGLQQALQSKIDHWHTKSGKVCQACEQAVSVDHISSKIEPIVESLEGLKDNHKILLTESKAILDNISKAESIIATKKPNITLRDIENLKSKIIFHEKQIKRFLNEIAKIEAESNPHESSLLKVRDEIAKNEKDLAEIEKDHQRMELLNKHYHYIYKAYNDRTKIKNYIFRDHVPFINSRLKYYLDVFELDIKIELTDSLGITSNLWGYEFESGGERKRTDVAFMLAMFDFHEQMYGRQCNVLVLDEVDGRLDDEGIDALINIIKNDLANRVESVLIISHRNMMFDTFEKEIKVTRKDRYSYLEVL